MPAASDLSRALSAMLAGFGETPATATDARDAYEESAAILEFDHGLPRAVAERRAAAALGLVGPPEPAGPDPP